MDEFGSADILHIAAQRFLEEAPERLARIRQSLTDGDPRMAQREAHALKGGAATLEAAPLAQAAADLEDFCRENANERLMQAAQRVDMETERLRAFAQSLANG